MVNERSGLGLKSTGAKVAKAKPRPAMAVGFELMVSAEMGKGYVGRLKQLLPEARPQVKGPLAELSVILIGDDAMAKLHWDFMKIEGPTDVMTFPIDLDAKGRPISGEVYVCVPYAQREAKERGVKAADEVLLYAVHGMLHLCGYDDKTGREFAKMHAKEDSILKAIGVGTVFARDKGAQPTVGAPAKQPKQSASRSTRFASNAAKRGKTWR